MTETTLPVEGNTPLSSELLRELKPELCESEGTYNDFIERVRQGNLTRAENPATHFGVFVLPINAGTGEVFLVFHKKANTWIPAGGHIETSETTRKTLRRESGEELGLEVDEDDQRVEAPFFFSTVNIEDPKRACKKHYDIWHIVNVQKEDIKHLNEEASQSRWIKPQDALAEETITDPSTLKALERLASGNK